MIVMTVVVGEADGRANNLIDCRALPEPSSGDTLLHAIRAHVSASSVKNDRSHHRHSKDAPKQRGIVGEGKSGVVPSLGGPQVVPLRGLP